MKDIYELLRQKELEISKLRREVEALRIAVPLLLDNKEIVNANKPTSVRSTAPSAPAQVPRQ